MPDMPSPLSQLLQGGASGGAPGGRMPMQGGPQAQQPTGLPGPYDPMSKNVQKVVRALKALAQMYGQLGAAKEANDVDQMAVDLDRLQLSRDAANAKKQKDYQSGASMPSDNPPMMM